MSEETKCGCPCHITPTTTGHACCDAPGYSEQPKDGDTLPLPTGPRPDVNRLAWLMSGMPKVGRTSVDIHVFDGLRAEVDALRQALHRINDGRHGDLSATEMALIAWGALRGEG